MDLDLDLVGLCCIASNTLFFFFWATSECWVLHSTAGYAKGIISQTGLQKPSSDTLVKVAQELFEAFRSTGLHIPQPFFMKAHRWLVH